MSWMVLNKDERIAQPEIFQEKGAKSMNEFMLPINQWTMGRAFVSSLSNTPKKEHAPCRCLLGDCLCSENLLKKIIPPSLSLFLSCISRQTNKQLLQKSRGRPVFYICLLCGPRQSYQSSSLSPLISILYSTRWRRMQFFVFSRRSRKNHKNVKKTILLCCHLTNA